MLEQCIFTISPVLGRLAVHYVVSSGLKQKHNGGKNSHLQNPGAAPKRGHHLCSPSTLLVTEMCSLENK